MRPPKTIENSGLGDHLIPSELVSDGLERPLVCHNSGTNDTNLTQDGLLSPIDKALQMTKGLGTRECHSFRKDHFKRFEPICFTLASGYRRIAEQQGYREANLNLLTLEKRLILHDFNLSSDRQDLRDFATGLAQKVSRAKSTKTAEAALAEGQRIALLYGFQPPSPSEFHGLISPALERLCDSKWWRKKLEKIQKRRIDEIARDFRVVSQKSSPYVSGWGLNNRSQEKLASEAYLNSSFITNGEGQYFCLKEIADRNVSNPAIRRAELMTRVKGFELVANELGHIGEFYTITTPSRMHAQKRDGRRNPKYDGTTPKEASEYLNHLWQCVRAKLHRQGIHVYGFRVVEPHHDGTPHWHLLLFMPPAYKDVVRAIIQDYSLKADGLEQGAAAQRFKAIAIDPTKGSAAGYIAKYIAKNIDGKHLQSDLYGNNAKSSANRIEAWASIHGIRQFQQIGGPSVTVWRELRRLNEETAKPINEYFSPADAGDWAAFVMVMGGPILKRCERPLKPHYQKEPEALPSGVLNPNAITKYGDFKQASVKGLKSSKAVITTRTRQWHRINCEPRESSDLTAQCAGKIDISTGLIRGILVAGRGCNPHAASRSPPILHRSEATLDLCK